MEPTQGTGVGALSTVVEGQASVRRSHSRRPSRESSISSSERKGVKKGNQKTKQKPLQQISSHETSGDLFDVAEQPSDIGSACAGFPPGSRDHDEEMVAQSGYPSYTHFDQRSIEQHVHRHDHLSQVEQRSQQFIDQRSVHQHVHIEDQHARREAEEARQTALVVQAQAQRAVLEAEHAARGEVNRVVESATTEVNRVVATATTEYERMRNQNVQQQHLIEALQQRLQQQETFMMQQQVQIEQLIQQTTESRNSADISSPINPKSKPPRMPSSGPSTPRASDDSSELKKEMQFQMNEAVRVLGQQVGEAMKSVQSQINDLMQASAPKTEPHKSNSSPYHVPSHVSSSTTAAFTRLAKTHTGQEHAKRVPVAAGGGGDDDDDDDDDDSDHDASQDDWDDSGHGSHGIVPYPDGGGEPPDGGHMPGGAFHGDENDVYRGKDLAHITIPTLPKDASAFRGWRNSLIAKLSSIDRTGLGVIMRWAQTAFLPSSEVLIQHLETFSDGLPRLDAWLAGQLSEPKHMSGNIGMRFQGYLERAQLNLAPLKGRRMLHEVSRSFSLDRMRGSNLTQQALLELPLDAFSQADLRQFYDRVEFILNSIQPEHQPSEQTKYIFLYERLKRCNGMRRHIDRIKDSDANSRKRSFHWLWCRFGEYLDELKEDANQESIKRSLTTNAKPRDPKDPKPQASALASSPAKTEPGVKAAPAPPPKASPNLPPKKSDPKGKGKGKGKGDKAKAKGKGDRDQGGQGSSKDAPLPKAKSKAPCIFFRQGTCNRGDGCPFSHDVIDEEQTPKSKAPVKANAAPKSKTAAAVAFASLPTAAAQSESVLTAVVRMCTAPLRLVGKVFACVVPVLQSGASHLGLPVTSTTATSFCVDWIADSGAGRSLGSVSSLEAGGIPSNIIQQNSTSTEFPINFATGGGSRKGELTIGYHGDVFGFTNAYLLPKGCPMVRSLGEIVNQQDRPFVWLPGELPFFATSSEFIQVACSEQDRIVANRVEENVPIFRENIKIVPGMAGEASSSSAGPPPESIPHVSEEPDEGSKTGAPEGSKTGAPEGSEIGAHDSDADSEGGVEWVRAEMQRARSIEHRLAHFPKSNQCLDCKIAKCYKKRKVKKREYELLERGLDPVSGFGERIAIDFIVVGKTAESKTDHYVLTIRDEWSGFLQGIPMFSRDGDLIVSHIKRFLGPRASAHTLVCKADVAKEFEYAAEQLGAFYEPTLERYWPHNSRLERDIRTFEESVRATHLAAGFAPYPSLWPITVRYCTVSLALAWTQPDVKPPAGERALTRLEAASGQRFDGPQWLLGQLVYYRVSDKTKLHKFDGSCLPGIFAGWRLENGCRFRGVVLVLDYEKLRTQAPGFEHTVALPQEEVVFDDHLTMPLKASHRQSLAGFKFEDLSKIPPITIPFSDEPLELPAKTRAEYITLDRLIKYGGTDGCRGCEMLTSRHTKACRDRFNRLIRADKPVPVELKPKPVIAEDVQRDPEVEPHVLASGDLVGPMIEEDIVPICPPNSDDESSGPAPTTPASGAEDTVGLSDGELLEALVAQTETNKQTWNGLSRVRRLSTDLPGIGVLYEYACSADSLIGEMLPQYGVKVVRLNKEAIDLSNLHHILQLVEQLKTQHGADIWMSLPCDPWSNLQELNIQRLGESFLADLSCKQAESSYMVDLALQVGDYVISNNGRFIWEWPTYCKGWRLPNLVEFIARHRLMVVQFHGCMLGLKGKQGKWLKKPWTLATNDRRVVELFAEMQCNHRTEQHEPCESGNAARTAYNSAPFVSLIAEALFPKAFYTQAVPAMSGNTATAQDNDNDSEETFAFGLVTRALSRQEWISNPKALEAIQKESEGLRANQTWEDETACDADELIRQSKVLSKEIKVAELLILCGIKHAELDVTKQKYKGRIVYRGDKVLTQNGDIVLFTEVSTSPTTMIALNMCLWWGALDGHATSTADAVQAFLQSYLPEDEPTYVILPRQLWLSSWKNRFHGKIAVKLRKSLYGHPCAGRLWQEYLESRIVKIGATPVKGFPSNFIFDIDGHRMILNVYVDDLTLSGASHLHKAFWDRFSKLIKIEDPQMLSDKSAVHILGRLHELEAPRTVKMSMVGYAEQFVGLYLDITGLDVKSLRRVATPHVSDSGLADELYESTGSMKPYAAKVLMKGLWLARLARPDISYSVGRLASRITIWTRAEDVHLHRLVTYVHWTKEYSMVFQAGGLETTELHVYADADLASCVHSARSTSGMMIILESGASRWPIAWNSRRQTSVARSTTEAEIISMASAVYSEGIPLLDFLEQLTCRKVTMKLKEDNAATLTILESGFSVKLRHASRTHRIDVASLAETIKAQDMVAEYCSTDCQAADALTKVIQPNAWERLLQLLSVRPAAK